MLKKAKELLSDKVVSKITAVMLIITLTFANVLLVGSYLTQGLITYATSNFLDSQTTKTNNKNIEFDAYFISDNNEKTHTIIKDVNSNIYLCLAVNVKDDGYLKNAKVEFRDNNNELETNYEISGNLSNTEQNEVIQSVDVENKFITLNQINNGVEAVGYLPISLKSEKMINLETLNKTTKAIFNGIYINSKGKEVNITKEINLNVGWVMNAEVNVSSQVNKYVPYNINGNKGIIIEQLIKSKIKNDGEKTTPIKETNIKINVNPINSIYPSDITVASQKLEATNGKTVENILAIDDVWNYDVENKIIEIDKINVPNENNVVWNENGEDEILITYIYPEKAYTNLNGLNFVNNVTEKVTVYNNLGTNEIFGNFNQTETLSGQLGNVVTATIDNLTKEVSKGKMYANYNSEDGRYQTEYSTKWNVDIANKYLIESLKIEDLEENFIDNEDNKSSLEIAGKRYTNYKQTKIGKNNFDRILGTEGFIKITNSLGEVLCVIDKNMELDQNQNYVINYSDNVGKIYVETSKPISGGNLVLEHKKVIRSDLLYSKEQVEKFINLQSEVRTSVKYVGEAEFKELHRDNTKMSLKQTSTNAKIKLDRDNLSTLVKNENVEIRIELNNNTDISDLYKNPIFEIELPSYIKNIEVKESNILFDDELKITSIEQINNNGKITLKILTSGTQTVFSNSELTNGTNIVINTNMETELLTPAVTETITLKYYNENAVAYTEAVEWEMLTKLNKDIHGINLSKVDFTAPTGVLNIASITNFDAKETTAISLNENPAVGKVEILDSSKTIKEQIMVINNYKSTCNEITVLGRVPFKDNTSILNNDNLGTNFNGKLQSLITAEEGITNEEITVYYSENGTANKELNDINNGWTTTPEDLSKIKSYMIITNNFELPAGGVIKLGYSFDIPADLQHNNSAFTTFVTYFKNEQEAPGKLVEIEATKVGVTTGAGPQIEAQQEISVGNGNNVFNDHRVKYLLKVKNTGNEVAENVNIRDILPENSIYVKILEDSEAVNEYEEYPEIKELTFNLGNINPNETKTAEFEVKVKLSEMNLINQMIVTAKDLEKEITNSIENPIKKCDFFIEEKTEKQIIKENEDFKYDINIKNVSENLINNVILTKQLPEGLTFKKAYIVKSNLENKEENVSYDSNSRIIKWNLENMQSKESINVVLEVSADSIGAENYRKDIVTNSKISGEGIEEYSSDGVSIIVAKPKLTIEQISSKINKYLLEGEELEYTVTVKNEGLADVYDFNFGYNFPEGLKVTNIAYSIGGVEVQKSLSNNVNITNNLLSGQVITVKVKAIAEDLAVGETEKTVTNFATFSAVDVNEIKSNEITYIVEQNLDKDTDNSNSSDESNTSKKYKISGVAWLDENSDGKKDENEAKLSNITAKLLKSESNTLVETVTTNSEGVYTFTNLEKGDYLVVFIYDSNIYNLTSYKKTGVADNLNSDVIATKVEENGDKKDGAITDIIKLATSSISDIDIGLVENKKFDLSLQKYITKMIIQNSEGTKVQEYKDTKLAKIDIAGKKIAGSTITIEYKMIVKNEGAVPGYAKKVVDYVSKDLTFNSELNPTWYAGKDGNLYNTELAQAVINPGETKEIKLILTKKMSQTNTGTVTNIAEICEDYNEQGLKDINSIPANNVQTENDTGVANAIITIKTGQEILCISIIIASIGTAVAVGIILSRKYLRK